MIDLRSDTITRPDDGMREAIASAVVGDDVFEEDPTVKELEETVADLLGKEAALFVPSGVMANQICIKVHTRPGEEIIAEERSHILLYESGAAPILSGVQVRTRFGENGLLTPDDVRSLVRGEDPHVAPISLLCLENTHNKAGGCVLPVDGMKDVAETAKELGLSVHLDGARLWNAAVSLGVPESEIAAHADSISVCFSKGLGAPIGSAVVGTRPFIDRSRRIRKMLGGGMRQVGIIAAAAVYALHHNRDRLQEDHDAASEFARIVNERSRLTVDLSSLHSNIVIMDVEKTGKNAESIVEHMESRGVRLIAMDGQTLRAVTHKDVAQGDVTQAAELLAETFPA